MTAATVTVLNDERLIREGEAAVDRYNRARASARTEVISMARGLLAAKQRYPATQDFGDWLNQSSYRELEHQDRAALIKIGEHEAFATKFIRSTRLVSPQTIWDAVRELLPSLPSYYHSNSGSEIQINPQNAPIPIATEPEQPVSPTAPSKIELHLEPISARHPFRGYDRAGEVAAIYRHGKTRSMIGAAINKRKQIWPLILQVIDAGLLAPTEGVREQPDLGILFPNAPLGFRRRFDLTDKQDLQAVKEQILPAVLANREAIVADPERIEEIIKSHAQQLRAQADAERIAQRIETAKATLKANEREVLMFGHRFWPIIDIAHPDLAYNYEELRHAVWTFRELHTATRLSSDDSPKSCGVRIRHIIKFLNGYTNARVMQLLVEMSRALQKNPEGKEQLPDMPNLDRSYE